MRGAVVGRRALHRGLQCGLQRTTVTPATTTPLLSGFNAGCRALATDAVADETPSLQGWRRLALSATGFYGRKSTLIRQANRMYDNCLSRAKSPELAAALGLDDSFSSRYVLLVIHIWMCLAKLRNVGGDGRELSQILFDNFWDDMTD